MKVTRKALLADMTLTNDLGFEIEKQLCHLFCKGEGISPFEIEKAPQRLCAFAPGQGLLESGSVSVAGLASRLASHIGDIRHAGRLKGSLVVYSIFPADNEGFLHEATVDEKGEAVVGDGFLTPRSLALQLLEELGLPQTQPWFLAAHIGAGSLVHMHLLFSRHIQGEENLATEGPDGWGLRRARKFVACKMAEIGRDKLSAEVLKVPGIGSIVGSGRDQLVNALRVKGIFISDGPTPGGMKCSAWGASETFTFGE